MTTVQKQFYWEDVQEGHELLETRRTVGNTQMFLLSAITGNPHRIHYDKDWAAYEGYPNVVVQGPLHGNYMAQLVMNWMGDQGRLRKFGYSNRAMAFSGDELVFKGRVKRKWEEGGQGYVELEVWDENPRGEVCALGFATVVLPWR